MFDPSPIRHSSASAATAARMRELPGPSGPVAMGSESVPPAVWRWLASTLDELDYGIVLLFNGMRIVHINDAARVELDDKHPLQLLGDELRAKRACDVAPLHEAVTDAALRGMRRLITVGKDTDRACVSIIPLEAADAGPRAVLVVLGKRSVCEPLSVQGFARSNQLTGAETRVLVELCKGISPAQVARQAGVAISTVRSQIGSIRLKTGAENIRALVRQVAVLPPVKSVLLTRPRALGSRLSFGSLVAV